MNNNNLIIVTLIILTGILITYVIFLKLDYYKKTAQYRLDPLEESTIHISSEAMKDALWIIGDSRAKSWDTSFLHFLPYKKVNLAIGGQSTKQVLERFKNDLEITHPKLILLQVGINDLKSIGFLRDPYITRNCISNTIKILDICKEHHIDAIYTSIFPVGDIEMLRRPLWKNNVYDSIKKVNHALKEYCKKNNVHFFDAYTMLLSETHPPTTTKTFQKDFLHLNETGYQFLTKKLEEEYSLYK